MRETEQQTAAKEKEKDKDDKEVGNEAETGMEGGDRGSPKKSKALGVLKVSICVFMVCVYICVCIYIYVYLGALQVSEGGYSYIKRLFIHEAGIL